MASLFSEYKEITDKYESLFMIVVHGITAATVHENIMYQIAKVGNIKNNVKRKYLNDRLYNFSVYLTEQKYFQTNELINKVFLISDNNTEITMEKKWVTLINHYDVPKYIFKNGDTFDIVYLIDLLTNENYKNVIVLKNNTATHIHFTDTKKRENCKFDLKNKKLEDYLKENIKNDDCVVHGVSSSFKNLTVDKSNVKTVVVENVYLKDEELRIEFNKLKMHELHKKLQETLDHINNPKMMDRILVGNQILDNLKNQMVKTIFCTPPRHKKLLELFSENDIANCEIIVVTPLSHDNNLNDPVMTLRKNYNGIIGMTYY